MLAQKELRKLIDESLDAREARRMFKESGKKLEQEIIPQEQGVLTAKVLDDCPQEIRRFQKKLSKQAGRQFGSSILGEGGLDETAELLYQLRVLTRYFVLPVAKMLQQPDKFPEAAHYWSQILKTEKGPLSFSQDILEEEMVLEDYDKLEGFQTGSTFCTRCLRTGHLAASCYAAQNAKREPLGKRIVHQEHQGLMYSMGLGEPRDWGYVQAPHAYGVEESHYRGNSAVRYQNMGEDHGGYASQRNRDYQSSRNTYEGSAAPGGVRGGASMPTPTQYPHMHARPFNDRPSGRGGRGGTGPRPGRGFY